MFIKKVNIIFILAQFFIFLEFKIVEITREFERDFSYVDTNGWTIIDDNKTTGDLRYQCTNIGNIFGIFGRGVEKQYSNLPKHYQYNVSIGLIILGSWDNENIQFQIDNQMKYSNNYSLNSGYMTILGGNYCGIPYYQENVLPLYLSYTQTHTSDTILLKAITNLNELAENEGIAIQNIIVTVDSCHFSCLQCNGPNEDNCTSCPTNSDQIGNTCICHTNFTAFENSCISSCPGGLTQVNSVCIQDCPIQNCNTCLSYECTVCTSPYKLLNGKCITRCPFWTTDQTTYCQDTYYESLSRKYSVTSEFIEKKFNDLQIQNDGWVLTKKENNSGYDLTGFVNGNLNCGHDSEQYVIGQGQMIGVNCVTENCQIYKTYSNIPPHYKIKIKLKIIYGDTIDGGEYAAILVDDNTVYNETHTPTTNICGNNQNDQIKQVDTIETNHTSQTLKFGFKYSIDENQFNEFFGFRELQIIALLCNNDFCTACSDATTCTSCKGSTGQETSRLVNSQCSCPVGFENNGTEDECIQSCITLKCGTCSDNVSCDTCTGANRDPTQVCICVDGYYDNFPTDQDCLQCNNNRCATCSDNTNSCDTCKFAILDNRIQISQCQCPDGYFDKSTEIDCQLCDGSCYTCVNFANNCVIPCDNHCATCSSSQSSCDTCKGDRINIPDCNCPDHKYDDFSSTNCIECDITCVNCLLTGCQTCEANRQKVLSGDQECICPSGGIDHSPDTFYCTTCDVAVLNNVFSNDYLYISIKFYIDVEIVGYDEDITIFSNDFCSYLLSTETIGQLGVKPQCKQQGLQEIKIKLGAAPQIQVGDDIKLNANKIKGTSCGLNFSSFILLSVNLSDTPLPPSVVLYGPSSAVSICENIQITIGQIINDGYRGLKEIQWSLFDSDDTNTTNLESILNNSNNSYIELPSLTFNEYKQYFIQMQFKNHFNMIGITTFEINTLSKSGVSVLIQQTEPFVFKNYKQISFYSEFKFLDCSSGVTQEQDKELQIQWIRIDQTSQEEILEEYLSQSTDRSSELQIQQYQHTPGDTYNIKIKIQVPNQNLDTFFMSQYKIEVVPLMVYIEGGNRMNAYASPLEISGVAKDPNVQKEFQTDGITKNWSCQNMNNQQNCQLIDKSTVTFLNGLEQSFPKKVFEPYNALLFTLEGEKNTITEKGQAVIIIVETNLPVLAVQVPESFLSEKLNKNDDLQIDISFDGNADEVFFSLIFLYDFEVVATKSFEYNSFAFSIWDLFDNFQNGINELLIRVSMYDPQYFMPSQTSYNIIVNSPPINGSITVTPLQGLPLQTEFTIKLENYFDEDSPLSYKFQYYTNIQNYEKERISGKNPTSSQKNVLTSYQSQNSLISYLPQADLNVNTNTYDLLIMVSVSDSLGGITNVTQIVQIEPQINDSIDQQISIVDTKFQQSQTQDNNIMVQQLNLICIQIDQLEKQNESIKSNTYLKNIKLQIYDKLNSIKNQISSKVMEDQAIKSMNLLMEDTDLIIQKDNTSITNTFESIEQMIQNKKEELQDIQNSGQMNTGDNKITRKNDQANLLLGKQLQFMNQFSQAFDVAKNTGSNRRILSDSDIQQNQIKLLDMTKQINQALQITTLPNQNAVNFEGSSFKQSVQKNTHKKVLQKYFKVQEKLNGFQQQSETITFDGESQDNTEAQDKIFNTSTQIFKSNILKDTPKFPYPDQSNQLYDIDIYSSEDQSKQITVHDNLSLSFGKKDQEKNQVCISQVQEADDWDSSACKNVEYEDPSGETYLECECKTLSPVTIIADIQNIFENSTLSEAFSNEGLEALSNFKFWLSIIFYFFVFQTGVLIVFIVYGYKQDKIDSKKKMDQKNKNLEKNIQENIKIEQKEQSEGNFDKNLTNENNNSLLDEKEINIQKKRKLSRKSRKQNQVQPFNYQFAQNINETDRSQNTPDQLIVQQQLEQPKLDIVNIVNDDHMANSKDELKTEDKVDTNTNKNQQSQIVTPGGKFQQRKSFFNQQGYQAQNNSDNNQELNEKQQNNNNDNQLNENDKVKLLKDNDIKSQILEEKNDDNDNLQQNNIGIRKRKFKKRKQSKFQDLTIEEPESETQNMDQKLEKKIKESPKNQTLNLNNDINMNENIEIPVEKMENSQKKKNEFLEDKSYKNEKQSNEIQKESLGQEQQELKTKEELKLQKEKEYLIKRKQIINFVLRIHEFIGIYYQYDEKLSRPVRYSCFYLKICIILAFTSSFITEESTQYMSILISVTTSILSGIPLAILKKLLSSNIVLKMIGLILYLGCLLVSVFLMITNAALMGVNQSNQWTYAYISSFFIDVFFFQIVLSFIKLILFNWSIGKQGCAILIRKVLSLEKGIDKYFKKKEGLQGNQNQEDIIDYGDISF